MDNDSEEKHISNLEEFIKEFPNLKKEISSLKRKVARLSGIIQKYELLKLDEQIFKLDEKVNDFSNKNAKSILALQRVTCSIKINIDVGDFAVIIENTRQLINKQTLNTQLLTDASSTKALIQNSNNPVPLLDGFRKKWIDFLRSKGADFTTF